MKKNIKLLKEVQTLYIITYSLAILGGFLLIGTVGALECDTISIAQALVQTAIGGASLYLFSRCAKCLEDCAKVIKAEIRSERVQKARSTKTA